ncbi:endonuclease/exonuclease/phosphatase family protein [Albimonas sp. CAU 1670]|uniref:endonuclease/exonuclease/phosphatase family protein n=1 Tax=Albimonas sp. CAU 1670 TaxID=3032599 RepID=UPI0023DC522E|nr:endonuclease/exonuclease/phosphatase family protein [Albimonas sp. CAU 1670]MDF2231389.1 endonuclease/exonuclease/phosphatase family protein [Albimonas sp. CAU 1670]
MRRRAARLRPALAGALALAAAALAAPAPAQDWPPPPAEGSVRVATWNVSLSRAGAGLAWKAVAEVHDQARDVARVIRAVRPDVLLVQELDHDAEGRALAALADLLAQAGPEGAPGLDYPYRFAAPSNTGVPSGLDLDGDGEVSGPGDAWGWGRFAGQYGMAVLSRLPLDVEGARSFRLLPWAAMPGNLLPADHYDPGTAARLRLSSKSHWDLAATLPDGRRLHLLASHPTPPVFDGPEDRNGRRNHDEIRFWADYLSGEGWMVDDAGRAGALPPEASAVVLGDLNADPADGDGRRQGIRALLSHPRLQDPRPASPGAAAAARAQGGANDGQAGDPALDTADWRDERGPGNLRVDFVLPTRDLEVTGAGVFWPAPDDPRAAWVAGGRRPATSDHRLVWVDLR